MNKFYSEDLTQPIVDVVFSIRNQELLVKQFARKKLRKVEKEKEIYTNEALLTNKYLHEHFVKRNFNF